MTLTSHAKHLLLAAKWQLVQGGEFDTLEQAKREAILLAMQQRDAEQVYVEAIAALRGPA